MPMIAMMEDTISLAGSSVSDDVASYVDVDVEMDDHDAIATATTSTMSAHPNRVSMEEYYSNVMQHARNIHPIEPTDAPPSYDLSMAPSSLRRTFSSPVQPREDEGNEQLPEYSSAISLECIFSRKMELEGPIKKAHDRNWSRIFVTLQGTALSFYTFKAAGMLAKHQLGQKTPDLPAGTKKGFKFKTYNLQHADVGIAADYLKRPYVIRVRAEADQFLLSCKRIETFVQWLQSLRAAIDLAPPLDERQIPKDHSVPRSGRYRRRPVVQQVENVAQVANDITAATIAEETAASSSSSIVQSRSTVSVDVIPVTSGSSATSSSSSTNNLDSNGALENVGSAQNQASSRSSQSRTANMDQARQARNERFRTAQQRLSSSANPNPSISQPDGKWRPVHKWGPMYDMMYARRCMAILTHKSPRKSNMVIMKGNSGVVDWATGKVERWEPPDYEA